MKNILIGITGGIAAFKSAQLVSNLSKNKDYNIEVLMTKNACEFINPLTFQTLSKNRVTIDSFDTNYSYDVHHISQAKKADVFVIVPASANVIAKVANGIADDALTTTFLACTCPKIICPAMNTNMLNNPVTQNNINKCKEYGYSIVNSISGLLACGDVGDGKLADIDIIEQAIAIALQNNKPFAGKNVLINAGPTQESIDPVRYITNHSSGKMGYSLAKCFRQLGAKVTLIIGPNNLKPLYDIDTINVTTALDMYNAIKDNFKDNDIIILSSAVADYRPITVASQKIKKSDGNLSIECERTDDILKYCGTNKTDKQILVGFAMETNNLIENAIAKANKKNCDLLVANTINKDDEGFGVDTNRITLVNSKEVVGQYFGSKDDVAYYIAQRIEEL